eukprot:569890-Rhodomonas_salina.5
MEHLLPVGNAGKTRFRSPGIVALAARGAHQGLPAAYTCAMRSRADIASCDICQQVHCADRC